MIGSTMGRMALRMTGRMTLRMTLRMTASGCPLVMVIVAAGPAMAQTPTLPRVDSLVTAGDYDAARTALDQWWSARGSSDAPGSDKARALLLRAKLQTDPDAAESDYLALVLGYPASPLAPEALLRLGQGLLATGDASRAAAYLHRLTADYPGRPERPAGFLWLARANAAIGEYEAACRAANTGLTDARDPQVVGLLRIEAGTVCSSTAQADWPTDGQAGLTGAAPGATPGAERRTPATGLARLSGEWAVQTGAFRQRSSASALMERLRRAGYSPRLVLVPRSDLMRVRVGHFTAAGPASELLTRLRNDGFDAVVVRDADQEREP